jgi:branched-subunit amino acid transport protein AzlD
MSNSDIYIAIAIMSVISFFTRVLPFLFFKKRELPESLEFVGKYFPAIILTILVFYTIKDMNFTVFPYGLKEISAIIFTACLHILMKNYLLSIFVGTIFYMGLVQFL